MGKKKKALQAEIDRLNAQKPPTEITSYKNINNTPRTSVAAVLGSAMTGYKTSSGPSMYGDSYNYKEINSCGPSMKGNPGLKLLPEVDKLVILPLNQCQRCKNKQHQLLIRVILPL